MGETDDGARTVAAIIPTCRRPELLLRALDSVRGQTRRPDEVVVADVGASSWDNEAAQLFSAEAGLTVRRLVLPSGSPAGAARNRGAEAAHSEWLAFLDDDDEWDSRYLQRVMGMIEPGVDAVATRLRLRRGESTVVLPPLPTGLRAEEVLIRNPGITGSNLVVSAAAFRDRLGGYDETLTAFNDLDLLVRALDHGLIIRMNQDPGVEQLVHASGQATNASRSRLVALEEYSQRYVGRMSLGQRITVQRERHRMLKHLDSRPTMKAAHWLADLAMTSPRELLTRVARRSRLGGGYD